jgi:hypothetical protein
LLGSGARAIEKQTFCEKRRRRMRQDVVSVLEAKHDGSDAFTFQYY